jgi:iron uptake system component EfeO
VIDSRDPALGPLLDRRFAAFTALLDSHRTADGFPRYTTLTQGDIKAMTDALDALSEPVSQVAAVVTS